MPAGGEHLGAAADHLVGPGKSDPSLAALGFLTVNDSFQGDTTLQTDDDGDITGASVAIPADLVLPARVEAVVMTDAFPAARAELTPGSAS